ncbi:hypothetical protein BKA93DRAFT_830316 [Sparassis latifolia]
MSSPRSDQERQNHPAILPMTSRTSPEDWNMSPNDSPKSNRDWSMSPDDLSVRRHLMPGPHSPMEVQDPDPEVMEIGSVAHRAKWVEPLPLRPPTPFAITTLHDALRVELPRTSHVYKTGALTSTRAIRETVIDLHIQNPLHKVVYLPTLVTSLRDLAMEELKKVSIKWGDLDDVLAMTNFHPYNTSQNLPKVIWSEKDVEHLCHAELFRPALAAVRAVISKNIKDSSSVHPYVSSAPNFDGVIPDGMVVLDKVGPDPTVGVVIENKTPSMWADGMKFSKLERPTDETQDARIPNC